MPPLCQAVKDLCPSVKAKRIKEVQELRDSLGLSAEGAERWNGYIAAMENVPADDRWWENMEDIPAMHLVRAVQDILKIDPQWPN